MKYRKLQKRQNEEWMRLRKGTVINMKIILLQDEKKLGKKGDIIEASEGYARNYILPKKIGVEATGEGGRAFGSVSNKEIATACKEQHNIELDKKKIQLPESLKNFGAYEVAVKLHPQVTAKLTVKVVEA